MNLHSSPLVEMEQEARRPTPWWLAWIISLALIVGGDALGLALAGPIVGTDASTQPLAQYAELFVFGIILLGLFAWVRLKEGRRFSSIGFRGPKPVGKLYLGLAIGGGMMTIGVLVPWAMGQYALGASTHLLSGVPAVLALIPLLAVFVLQGSTEEAVIRGYMLQTGGRSLPGWVAIIGSSVFFAVIHLDFTPVVLANITLYAVFACFVALREGGLWLIGGIHAGWNFFQGNIFGLPVSGHGYATTLFTFGPAPGSNDLLTGGDFGVEKSLVGTAILLAATVVAYLGYRRTEAERAARPSRAIASSPEVA